MSMSDWFVDMSDLTPHGFCLTWQPGLLWLDAGSDAVTMVSYYSIPLALLWFLQRRRDLPHRWIAALFVAFILACGTDHLMAIVTLWVPAYHIEGVVKLVTALLSVATAVLLWPLVPRLVELPSVAAMAALNTELRGIIAEQDRTATLLHDQGQELRLAQETLQRANEELEQRVAERVAELSRINRALVKSEGRFRLVVEASPNAMVMINAAGRIEMVNAQTERMFAWPRADLLGQPIETLLPDRLRSGHAVLRLDYFKAPHERMMGDGGSLFGRRRDGSEFRVKIGLNPIETDDGMMVLSAIVDISERVRLEEEYHAAGERSRELLAATNLALRQRSADLEARNAVMDDIGKVAHRLPCCTDLDEFALVLERFLPRIIAGAPGALYVINNSATMLTQVAGWGGPVGSPTNFLATECWGLRRGQPHVVADATADMICQHVTPGDGSSHRCLPLVAQGVTVGLLYLEGPIDPDSREINIVAETIAQALVNMRLRETLRNQSIRDHLTGLFNRRYLEEALEIEVARARRAFGQFALVMLDIDHFKQFNDSFGHDGGDVVLRAIGELLTGQIRKGDIACRYGGEEFAVVLSGADAPGAAIRSEAVRQAAQALVLTHDGRPLGSVTASFGIAVFSGRESPRELVAMADDALYVAKRSGRNRVHVFSSALSDPLLLPQRTSRPDMHIPMAVDDGGQMRSCHVIDLWQFDIVIDIVLETGIGGFVGLQLETTKIRARVVAKTEHTSQLAALDDPASRVGLKAIEAHPATATV